MKYVIFLILSLLGLTQDDNYSPSASSSSRPSHQGVKRKYKSNNVKTSYPKKEPKIELEISLEHPDEHAIGQDEDIGEDYRDYGEYEAGPSGEDDDQLAKFKRKFAHFSEFYYLMDAKRGQNNTYSLEFQCTNCVKLIRASSRAPTSNLKAHISTTHTEYLNLFLTLRGCNKDKVSTATISIEKI